MNPSLGRRFAARLVDGLLLAIAGLAWGWPMDYGIAWLIAHAALVYLYFVVGDAVAGGTVGKRALGLRVEDATGGKPSWGQAARREAFVLAGAVPFVGPLLALGLWIAIAVTIRSGEGLHDRFADGTRVVRPAPRTGDSTLRA